LLSASAAFPNAATTGSHLALQDELESMPFSAVGYADFSHRGVPACIESVAEIKGYEEHELTRRE
jgi:L-rhamnose isomerase